MAKSTDGAWQGGQWAAAEEDERGDGDRQEEDDDREAGEEEEEDWESLKARVARLTRTNRSLLHALQEEHALRAASDERSKRLDQDLAESHTACEVRQPPFPINTFTYIIQLKHNLIVAHPVNTHLHHTTATHSNSPSNSSCNSFL